MRKSLRQIALQPESARNFSSGGHVRGPGTETSDSIPAWLSDGEFVLPSDTVRKVGVKRLRDLVHATHQPTGRPRIPGHYADGTDEVVKRANSFGDAAAAAADSSVQQIGASPAPASAANTGPSAIPTGGLQAPAPDGSQDRWSNTEVGRNLSNIASALPGAAGNVIPAVAKTGGAISSGIDAATRLMAIGTGTAGASMAQPAVASAVRSEPLSLQAIGAGRGNVNPPFVDPSAPIPTSSSAGRGEAAGPSMAASGSVTRDGNSYSGTNVAGDVTFRNPDGSVRASGGTFSSLPSSFQPSSSSTTSATSGGDTQPSGVVQLPSPGLASAGVGGGGMDAADALASREYAASMGRLMASGKIAAPTAGPSLVLPGGSFGIRRDRNIVADERGAQSRFAYAMGNDPASRQRAALLQQINAQQQGETNRTMIRARSDADRTAVERGKLSLAKIAAGYDNKARERLDRAQSDLESAKTPEAQRTARDRLLALAGKAPQNEWALQVTPTTKNLDGSTTQGSVYRYNKTTGETVRVDDGRAPAAPKVTSQEQFDALPKGAAYMSADGRMYRKPD